MNHLSKAFCMLLIGLSLYTTTNGQTTQANPENPKVIIDNDKIKVTEFISNPQGDVCGKGVHSHGPHLTVLLTDAEVEITNADGKKITQKVPAGTTFWSEAVTHEVVNVGKKPMKVEIIETK